MARNQNERPKPVSGDGKLGRDIGRATVATVVMLSVLGGVSYLGGWNPLGQKSAQPRRESTAADFQSAAIVIMSPSGEICRQGTFDNSTGRIVEKGSTSCEVALGGANKAPAPTGLTRVETVLGGFRNR